MSRQDRSSIVINGSRHAPRILIGTFLLATASNAAHAQDAADTQGTSRAQNVVSEAAAVKDQTEAAATEVKTLSGISILGNQEAPKSLVIVPWKSSEIGDMPGLSRLLDDSVQPIDKEVFMRELDYYEIRSSSK